jgi:DNA-directed RNA polymerase subunit M/transcription elongation factor TFIIS
MSLFCKYCNNLLIPVTTSDTLHFKCAQCAHTEEPSDEDTLRFEEVSGINFGVYKEILLTAGKDPVNPKVVKKCTCGSSRVRQVRLGREMKLINTCIKCNKQWQEGTEIDSD